MAPVVAQSREAMRAVLGVLDACASPGGKTTALAAVVSEGGYVVACDVRDRRMSLLRRTVERTGASHVRLVQADLLAPLPFRAPFDTVVVDAPCSGLGTLRRDPDIRWRRLERDLPGLADVQKRMLKNAADRVAPGGRVVYATCSSEPEENEEVADAFLEPSERDLSLGFENATSHPAPGQVIVYPGGMPTSVSETEILIAYGPCCFASKAGQLAGNHFLSILDGGERLAKLGRAVLWEGAKSITFRLRV